MLGELNESYRLEKITAVGPSSGTGKAIVPAGLRWAEYSSSLSIASGLLQTHPDAKSIIQIGGQSSLVIELEDGLKSLESSFQSSLCRRYRTFLEQQSYRLGIQDRGLRRYGLEISGSAPRIAARCSVFAKSDLIHLQQKGVSVEAMLYALCESIARMVVALKKGIFAEPVYFVGGVAANGAIAKALNEMLSERNGHPVQVIVPENYLYYGSHRVRPCFPGINRPQARLLPEDGFVLKTIMNHPSFEDVPMPGNALKGRYYRVLRRLSGSGCRLYQHQGGDTG